MTAQPQMRSCALLALLLTLTTVTARGQAMLNVNDKRAALPVTSAPVFYLEQEVTGPEGAANDYFGFSVALSGDTALVGAYYHDLGANSNQGSAYIFTCSDTTWSLQQQLTAPDGAEVDWFGYSVAVEGDTALVGAYADDVDGRTDQGSVYVFTRSGTTWTQQQKLTPLDGTAYKAFGYSVALSGETALVGAYADDVGGNTDQGSAYVFTRSNTTWSQQQKLTASDGAADDLFGHSVALSGDTALVGAYYDDVGGNVNQGSAYVFTRNGTTWGLQQQLAALDGEDYDYFAYAVALFGDTALLGAYGDVVGANARQGSAYVFTRTGTAWGVQQQLTASDGAPNDYLGVAVALSGDTALVGAYGDDVATNGDQGSAYVFTRSETTWTQRQQLTASDGAPGDGFGRSVALSGDTALVGAPYDDIGANTDQGSAHFYFSLKTYVPLAFKNDPEPWPWPWATERRVELTPP